MAYSGSQPARQIEKQKAFRAPKRFKNSTKHPKAEHVEQDMREPLVRKHMRHDLVRPEIRIRDGIKR